MSLISGLNHITLAVRDIEESFVFYKNVLGLKPLVKWNQGAYFLIDQKNTTDARFWFCLNVDKNSNPSASYTHYAFTVAKKDFSEMAQRIVTSGATIFKENTSPGKSLYFLDPDGHKLEIHVGDWQKRIEAKKTNLGNWQNVEWFV